MWLDAENNVNFVYLPFSLVPETIEEFWRISGNKITVLGTMLFSAIHLHSGKN